MKKQYFSALALALGVLLFSSCAIVSLPEKATTPEDLPIYGRTEEPETAEPVDPAALIGIWYNPSRYSVFCFGADGILTVYSLAPGYDYEYSDTAQGTYHFDGQTITITLGEETVTEECRIADSVLNIGGFLTFQSHPDLPTEHPSYPFPDFEALAAGIAIPDAALLTGQTIAVPTLRLKAWMEARDAYYSGITPEKKTEGTASLGDRVNIDYTGKLDGVPFAGGSATGADITVAPDTGYIPGFAEGVAGHSVGETFDVEVTFPESYGNAELAGRAAVFTMTLNAIYDTPLTDDMVSAGENPIYQTVEEWVTANLRELLTDEIWSLFPTLDAIPDSTDAYLFFYQNMQDYYHYYYALYGAGTDFETFLLFQLGKTPADLEADSRETARCYLLAAVTARALNLTPDEEWCDAFTEEYLTAYLQNGYTEEEARELISEGEGRNRYRAFLLYEYVADHLFSNNTFTD